ncbi:putative L-sorbosone dehydrogenase [Planctomycetales bacterium 10988]|nr:putative L-sorbosone dehydrogenase [Planctomycetales bacterium 10988]
MYQSIFSLNFCSNGHFWFPALILARIEVSLSRPVNFFVIRRLQAMFSKLMRSTMISIGILGGCVSGLVDANEIEIPRSLDDRLTVELFAAEPDTVTVTGLSVDPEGRVFVVESHTHFRPEGYQGPPADRIRLLEDTDHDGRADRIETFFAGSTSTMNIAVHPNGWVYVATRASIFRLFDHNQDGKADRREDLIKLETEADYPHNGLSGFAIDFDGTLYFGLGENMGEDATLISPDKSLPSPRGCGGVFRCQEDGAELERVAIGFWNPFHLCFDTYGRLFLGDNDPGNRPPCRFLSIVEAGDYGYRRRTLEPFIAVDGELPGTLPMTSSTGESPTGIVAYESDHLPAEYRGELLVASWGEHRIDRYRLERDGAGFRTTTQPMIAGGEHFRPAGIAIAPDGSLFVGDWADRSYPLHGKGRIWHIRAKNPPSRQPIEPTLEHADFSQRKLAARALLQAGESGKESLKENLLSNTDPRARSVALSALIEADAIDQASADQVLQDSEPALREQAARTLPFEVIDLKKIVEEDQSLAVQAAALRRLSDPVAKGLMLTKVSSDDAFLRQAARLGLEQSLSNMQLIELTKDSRKEVRLAAFLILKGAESSLLTTPEQRNEVLRAGLQDNSEAIRYLTVEWIGRDELRTFRESLIGDLAEQATTAELLRAYLAALAQLDGVMERWAKGKVGDWWVSAAESYQYALPLLQDPEVSPAVVEQVLHFLPAKAAGLSLETLEPLTHSSSNQIAMASIQRVREMEGEKPQALLTSLAKNLALPTNVRAEAIIGLDATDPAQRALLFELLQDTDSAIVRESLRSLRKVLFEKEEKEQLQALLDRPFAADLVARLLDVPQPTRPASEDISAWLELLEGPADAAAGQRIFFHPQGPGCAKCHRLEGRGMAIGPSLVRVGGRIALSRERMIEAILEPSREVDPGYLPVMILTTEGKIGTGIFYKHSRNIHQIINSKGEIESYPVEEIEEMMPSTTSIMPNGLIETMTTQEFRNLLAYLLQPSTEENED